MKDRQIELRRVIAAPPQAVWRCWTDPEILPLWFGPEGYSCKTKEIDLRVGGQWRFDMIAPDGTVFVNRHRYDVMDMPSRIAFRMDADQDDDVPILVVVTLQAHAAGCEIVQLMTLPSAEHRAGALAYGADRLGLQTLAKLAARAEAL